MDKNNRLRLLSVVTCCLAVLLISCLSIENDGANGEILQIDERISVTNSEQELVASTEIVDPTAINRGEQATITKTAIATFTGNLDECENSGGIVKKVLIPVSNNPKDLFTHIYLPPCYSENSEIDYPVLLLLHGQSFTADQWLNMGLKEYLDETFTNQSEGIIVVLPQENDYLLPIIESTFGDMIVNDLMKYLEENYQISLLREERAIGGISRGATWALKIGLNHWEEFGGIGLHSYPGGVNSTILYIKRIPEQEIPSIFIDAGTGDTYLNAAIALNEELNEFHITHEWHLNKGGHTQEYWSKNLSNYLDWYINQINFE